MKFNIQFAYKAKYRHHRHRNHQIVHLQSSVMVDIVEIEVPGIPAFEVGDVIDRQDGNVGWQRFRFFDERPGRVWRVDGVYFAEYCSTEDFEARVRLSEDNPFDASDDKGSALPFPAGITIGSFAELSAKKTVKEWYDDGGDGKAAGIAVRAGGMRVIEGIVCVPVGEPIVVVKVSPRLASVSVSELGDSRPASFRRWQDSTTSSRRYRLENLEEAARYASRTARESGTVSRCHVVVRQAQTYSSKFCHEGEHLYLTIKTLLWTARYCKFPLSNDDANCVLLKEVLARTPVHHATEALAKAAEAVLEKLKQVRKDDLPFPDFLKLFEIRRALEADLLAWRGRPYNEHDFSGQALPIPADERGFFQILSGLALDAVATHLRLPPGLLEREHELGHRLVHHGYGLVIVLTPALSIKCTYGKYGRIVTLDDEAFFEFLDENIALLAHDDDAQALADIQFD